MVYREKGGDTAAGTLQKVERIIGCAGAFLTRAHLEGKAGEALCRAVAQAASLGASLRLALGISDRELFNLPWETRLIPGRDQMDLVLLLGNFEDNFLDFL